MLLLSGYVAYIIRLTRHIALVLQEILQKIMVEILSKNANLAKKTLKILSTRKYDVIAWKNIKLD